jgi:glutamate racemase
VLIIDSGIGGLSILNDIKKNFPNIHYIYMLDNEAFPYGKKNERFLIERSISIIYKVQKLYPINIVIIACNTISTVSLPILKKIFNIPIIGTLPMLKPAIEKTKNKIIGLIGTNVTINSLYIKKIIHQYSLKSSIKIIATNKLAEIAEKKIRNLPISNIALEKIFKSWIILPLKPDTIILGCTHFSFLKKEIQKIFYKKHIYFITSEETIINKIKKYYSQEKIKENIFLYSKKNKKIEQLMFFLKKYKFKKIKEIKLN